MGSRLALPLPRSRRRRPSFPTMKPTSLPIIVGSEPVPTTSSVAVRAEAGNPSLAWVGVAAKDAEVRLDRTGLIAASISATTEAALWTAGADGVAA